MASSPQALTLILGPPARTEEREAFDRLQAAIGSGHKQEAEVCERRQAEYFADLFRPEAGTASIMDDLLSAFLGVAVRIRRYELRLGMARGLWVPCLTLARRNVEAQDGPGLAFPPTEPAGRDALATTLGSALQRDWVIAFSH